MKRTLLVGLLVLVFLSGCGGVKKPPAVPQEDMTALVTGNNEFALSLYAQLSGRDGNLFFSPYSVSSALGMTYSGARGETAAEMATALRFRLEPGKLHPAFAYRNWEVNHGGKRGYELTVANALWAQRDYGFLPEFLKLTRDHYGAGAQEVDFDGAPEQARQTINDWIEKRTKNKIKEALPERSLQPGTRLVLTNAIFFKGDWGSRFEKNATGDADFSVSAGQTTTVPMMHQRGRFRLRNSAAFQLLELPYKGDELSMVVLLPRAVDGLGALEKTLTADTLRGWIDEAHEQDVRVSLPKFKFATEFLLNDALAALGMRRAFSPEADLSGMNGRTNLYLDKVIHKAFVDVNEQGTEAAAVTVVKTKEKSIPSIQVFCADHPFLFLIRDVRRDSILFLGRLVKPS